jgi:hypothetical protein
MIAYAPAMSFLDRLRNMLAGPPRVEGGDAAEAAALQEEFGAPDEGTADVRRVEGSPGAGGGLHNVGFGASEAAEAAQDDLASEEPPPDAS